jgi:hypothetical protein
VSSKRVTRAKKGDKDTKDTQDAADHNMHSGGSLLYSALVHDEMFAITGTQSSRGAAEH